MSARRFLAGCLGGRNDGGAWGGQGRTLDGPSGLSFGLLQLWSGGAPRVAGWPDGSERYQRSEKALLSALVEMYVQGVSTRKVKKITEELCAIGSRPRRSPISSSAWTRSCWPLPSRLDEPFPYVIVDATRRCAPFAIGSASTAKRAGGGAGQPGKHIVVFLLSLKERGLRVEFVVSDDHPGLKKAIANDGSVATCLSQKCPGHAEKTRASAGCAGSTTAAISARRGALGCAANTPPLGRQHRGARSTGCPASSATIRRSSGAPTSCASFPTASDPRPAVETHEDWPSYINPRSSRELMKRRLAWPARIPDDHARDTRQHGPFCRILAIHPWHQSVSLTWPAAHSTKSRRIWDQQNARVTLPSRRRASRL